MSTIVYYNKKNREKKALQEAINNMSFAELQELFVVAATEKMKEKTDS
jgi:hypothetical protein